VRATAAGVLGEQFAPASETTLNALDHALTASAKDVETDARLAILDAIGKYTSLRATDLLVASMNDADYLVRRKAAELLEARGAGHFTAQVKFATTPVRPKLYYEKLEARMRKPNPTAILSTDKGDVRVELLMREAPMNAMNFIDLATAGYFDGIVFHRVVPNFVVQGGDPRGDGNGGPGYQIRCEINEVPYDRGAVGMALSGKDTGGSQFFFTHSPQPHLDGGYTVFGRVTGGMDVVDNLMRGDRILKVTILDSGGA
jgi:cyclophilin family peptidyl-prolyl cis-trans isomerase